MAGRDRCPRCGEDRPADAPRGHCPNCLLRNALVVGQSDPRPEETDRREAQTASVLSRIAAAVGEVPHVLLSDTDADGRADPGPVVVPNSPELPASAPSRPTGRYQLLGEVARGGMGAILKGRDADLGRDLAVKVLLARHRDRPEYVRRFVEEAQISGQLQHPGIVPVYELGTFDEGRPYFAMKLVKGRTLASLLMDRTDPSEEGPRFVTIFEAIAQTMAYAHARGVIHRDLKPSNVMVGSFGEVQVMDWGLAKVLDRGGTDDELAESDGEGPETIVATARSGSGADPTRYGSAIGTPGYMAPEQARGEVAAVDERADVFALGSILCEILTGRPAFTGLGTAELLDKAARGDLADAHSRLEASAADAELASLSRECLAPEPRGRPRDASAVARRVRAYLTGLQERLHAAELARAADGARAEEARHTVEAERHARRLTAALAGLIVGLVALGGSGYGWFQHARAERMAAARAAIDEALAESSRLRREAMSTPGDSGKWAEALAVARRAEDLLIQGEATALMRRRVADRVATLTRERDAADADRRLLSELESIRGTRAEHNDPRRADSHYRAAFRTMGLDLDAIDPKTAGTWIGGRSDPVELASYLDDWAIVRRTAGYPAADWRRLLAVAQFADPDPWRNGVRRRVAAHDEASITALRAMSEDRARLGALPAATLVLLAAQLDGIGDGGRAEKVLRRAWHAYPGDYWINLLLAGPRGQSVIGEPLEIYPHPAEALRYLTAAVAIRPGSSVARDSLAIALNASGDLPAAVEAHREAIRLKPDFAGAHNHLGVALAAGGELAGAVESYREAIRLAPGHVEAYNNLGNTLAASGDLAGAASALREAIRLKPGFAGAHMNLGNTLATGGELAGAVESYREAIRLDPDLAEAHSNLGVVLLRAGDLDGAILSCREAIHLDPDLADAHTNLGIALLASGDPPGAVEAHREAIRLKPGLAEAHNHLGAALRASGDLAGAMASYREAIRLDPDLAEAHCNLGNILHQQGLYVEALAEYRTGHTLGSRRADWAYPSADWVAAGERLVRLADRLPSILSGAEDVVENADRLAVAQVGYEMKRYAAAARLWNEVFTADSKIANNREAQHRYNAACAAALAVAGYGEDDPALDDAAKAVLRRQALGWLEAEYAAWSDMLERDPQTGRPIVIRTLSHWKVDPDLGAVRDPDSLEVMAESDRSEWRALWAEVDDLLDRARGTLALEQDD